MLQSSTIKRRVIITAIGLFFASTALNGLLTYNLMMADLKEVLKDFAQNENRLFNSILAAGTEGLARAHIGLVRLEPMLRLFAERDKNRLLATAQPIFDEIRQSNNITHMYFIDPEGTVFLRVHRPEQAGDKLSRATFRKADETGKIASGLE